MKKILFALVGVIAMAFTSCMPESGHSYSIPYIRLTTIDTTTTPIKFIADYTGEVFEDMVNLRTPKDLETFDLKHARRAEILVRLDVDFSNQATLMMIDAREIAVYPITNMVPTEQQMPLLNLHTYPLGGTTLKPQVWVSNGYLNVLPMVPSKKSASYYLTPEKAVNDSLFFTLTASYEVDSLKTFLEDIHSYDLRTLRDTANASPELREKMKEMLVAMEQHRGDSMIVAITGDFVRYNFNYQGKDTIETRTYLTNYFKYDF